MLFTTNSAVIGSIAPFKSIRAMTASAGRGTRAPKRNTGRRIRNWRALRIEVYEAVQPQPKNLTTKTRRREDSHRQAPWHGRPARGKRLSNSGARHATSRL